jgi:N-acetylglutamate synthase-like GNAT family acetyltransferase
MSLVPMSFEPTPARAHDLEPALELLRRLDLPEKGVVEHFGLFHVVRDDGRVVGLSGLEVHGSDGLLRSVAVEPAYRGQGLAASLVEASLGLARRVGLRAVYLLTTTASDYFRRHGFTDCPREEAPEGIRESWEFRAGCPSTSVFMKMTVGPASPRAR